MFGIKGFYVSASGAIQGHHGPLVLVYTLASTNINQSVPNLVRMYVTVRSWMSQIMDVIRPELFKLSACHLENLPYLTLLTL